MNPESLRIVVLMLSILAGGGNDLLDPVATGDYWQAKKIKVTTEMLLGELVTAPAGDITELTKDLDSDAFATREAASKKIKAMGLSVIPQLEQLAGSPEPEVATRAKALIGEIRDDARPAAIRRLMAIRTLGEMKKAEVLPALRPLLESKEPFVADYARRAIATIEGKAYSHPQVAEALAASDLALLPERCGVVGQYSMAVGKPLDVTATLTEIGLGLRGLGLGGQGGNGGEQKLITQACIDYAERLGDVRLDHVTLGISTDVGPNAGFVVLVGHGVFDSKAVADELAKADKEDAKTEVVDGTTVVTFGGTTKIMLAGEGRVVLVAGPNPDTVPIAELAAAIKTGKGNLAKSADMAKLLETVDRKGPVWMAAVMNDTYRQVPLFAPFDTMTLTGQARGEGIDLKLVAQGKDADKVKTAAEQTNAMVKEAVGQFGPMAKESAFLGNALQFMESVRCAAQGESATVEATLPCGPSAIIMLPMVGMRSTGRAERLPVEQPATQP